MNPTNVAVALQHAIQAKQPTILWGKPGTGKSDLVRQVAEMSGMQLRDIRVVLLDPVDLRGLPHVNGDGKTHWCIPEFLPTDGEGILFLDEINAAPQLIQAACYQLILDRKLGEYTLPDGWVVFAAGNNETDRAVTTRMSTALSNRLFHIQFEVDTKDWVAWALTHNIRTEIIAFIRFRPELLHNFNPTSGEKAFPTPRSWEFVSRMLNTNPPDSILFDIVAGLVGEAAAGEFVAFLKIVKTLPNPDAVIMAPDTAPVPTEPSTLYALCGALARKVNDQNFDRVVRYGNRLPREFGVLLMNDCRRFQPLLMNTRTYIEWASANSDVL